MLKRKSGYFESKYTVSREYYRCLGVAIPIFLIVAGLIAALIIDETRCYVFFFAGFNSKTDWASECIKNTPISIIINCRKAKVIARSFEWILMSTLLYTICKYNVRNDKLLIKVELFWLCVYLYFFHVLQHMNTLYWDYDYESIGFVFTLLYLLQNIFMLFAVEYSYCYRKEVSEKRFLAEIYDFDKFIRNRACFLYFQNYLSKDNQKYLSFWVKMYVFHKKRDEMSDLEFKFQCREIINWYFPDRTSINSLNIPMSTVFNTTIPFPMDILQPVIEEDSNNFEPRNQKIFEKSFRFVYNYLYQEYVDMLAKEENKNELEDLVNYIDFVLMKNEVEDSDTSIECIHLRI